MAARSVSHRRGSPFTISRSMILGSGDAERRSLRPRKPLTRCWPADRDAGGNSNGPARHGRGLRICSRTANVPHGAGVDLLPPECCPARVDPVRRQSFLRYASFAIGAKLFRNSCRARLRRDITVPIGTSKIPAASRQVNPSTTHSNSTVRCSIGNASSASAISTASCSLGWTQSSETGSPELLAALAVKRIEQNAEQPRPRIGAGLETMEPAPGEQHGLLHQVFGGRWIKRQASSHTQQGRQMRHGNPLEFLLLRGHFASSYRQA